MQGSLPGCGEPATGVSPAVVWGLSITSLRCPVVSWPPHSPSPPKSTLHKVVGAKPVKHRSDASLLEMLLSHRGLSTEPSRSPALCPALCPAQLPSGQPSPVPSPVPSPAPQRAAQPAPAPPQASCLHPPTQRPSGGPFHPPHRNPLLPGLLFTLCILQAAFLKPQPSPAGRFSGSFSIIRILCCVYLLSALPHTL